MSEKSKSSLFLEVIFSKDVTEAILKNIMWFFVSTTLIRLLPLAIAEREYLFSVLALITFLVIVVLNVMYGVTQILIPIDKGIGGHILLVKDLNKLRGQSDTRRLKRMFSFLLLTKLGIAYLISSFLYIWLVFTAIGLLVMPYK